MERNQIDRYTILSDSIKVEVSVYKDPSKFVPTYEIHIPKLEDATKALLEDTRDKIITTVPIKIENLRDPASLAILRVKIKEIARGIIKKTIPEIPENVLDYAVVVLANEMLGLGSIEFLLDDEGLEEVVINNSKTAIWVYHKKYGWLETNVVVPSEEQIENYSSIVGRRVGRQINVLSPLMDAHLLSGDRVNATLFPISSFGNTLTIRKFRREPWTVTDLLENNTLNPEIASFFWLCMQYELSMIIGGGTASGKTTMLNVLMPFIPPNERIISIEDTRELNLPEFLHWVPLTTRESNPEGKGEVNMLDLLINSLRMRPDRLVVGEIRRQPEAEVLFEALNTGHSVYSTLHANTAEEAFRRLVSPPIALPEELVLSLPLLSIMFRHRKLRIRRVFEVSELIGQREKGKANMYNLYHWDVRSDKAKKTADSIRSFSELNMFTGMTHTELQDDMKEKEGILKWMVKNKINTVNTVGKVVSEYYTDKENFMKTINQKQDVEKILGKFISELKK
jgi:flagellar protein FlaI